MKYDLIRQLYITALQLFEVCQCPIALHVVKTFFFRDAKFKKCDAFIGFQKDTPASVIFQATNQLKAAREVECFSEGRLADILNYSNQEEPIDEVGNSRDVSLL